MSGTEELTNRLQGILGSTGSRVASIRVLARVLRTSPTKVHLALRRLVSMNVVSEVGDRRKRYYVGHAPGDRTNEIPLGNEPIIDLIRREVLRGSLPRDSRGEYPTIKETAGRFGCGTRKVSHAMRRLAEEGLIHRRGKKYVASIGENAANITSSVHIVGPSRLLHAFTHGPYSAVSEIERGVLRRGWRPVQFVLTSNPEQDEFPSEPAVSSFVYIVSGSPRRWINRLNQLPRVPLVVIDGTGEFRMRPERNNCILIRASNREAGRAVGMSLIQHGHGHIAFIPAGARKYEWETDREEAIREVCRGAGMQYHLTTFSLEPAEKHVPTVRELLGWSGTRVRVILSNSGILPFEAVHERLRPLEKLDQLPLLMEMCRPAFDRAFRDRSITAWVCANDEVAILAMHYLRGKGSAALERISLVGFDNSPISYVMGIASYEFDFQSMARVALETIAHPEAVRRSEGQVIVQRGHVVLRGSLRSTER